MLPELDKHVIVLKRRKILQSLAESVFGFRKYRKLRSAINSS